MALRAWEEENGVIVWRVTDDEAPKSNVYCEDCFCSPDGRYFLYERRNPAKGIREMVRCEFGSWRQDVVAEGATAPLISPSGVAYFFRDAGPGAMEMMRLDIGGGRAESMGFAWPSYSVRKTLGRGTISCDERYFAQGVVESFDPQMFAIDLLDLQDGSISRIFRDPFISNPHAQFEPSEGRQILVQHNRGSQFAPDGRGIEPFDERGISLILVDAPSGKMEPLAVGPPHTDGGTGHEVWIGASKSVLLSTKSWFGAQPQGGSLYMVSSARPARRLMNHLDANHVNVSACGRYWCCDERGTHHLYAGPVNSDQKRFICDSRSSYANGQPSHAHAYVSRDLRWIVFNSDTTGMTQIHVAQAPEDFWSGWSDSE